MITVMDKNVRTSVFVPFVSGPVRGERRRRIDRAIYTRRMRDRGGKWEVLRDGEVVGTCKSIGEAMVLMRKLWMQEEDGDA